MIQIKILYYRTERQNNKIFFGFYRDYSYSTAVQQYSIPLYQVRRTKKQKKEVKTKNKLVGPVLLQTQHTTKFMIDRVEGTHTCIPGIY